jgi:carboxypeptidase C (cathepsin A)
MKMRCLQPWSSTFLAFSGCLLSLLIALSAIQTVRASNAEVKTGAEIDTKPDSSVKVADKDKPEAELSVTKQQIHIGDTTVSYTATAGTMLIKNEKDEPIALFGFTAYVSDSANAGTRPIVFAYNGGPGSSSIWLHMGILGPKRTELVDLEHNTRAPFRIMENEFSILDQADLVMIDPVGTGFSRPVGKAEGKDFWGVDQDVASVSNFIVQYLSEYGRWASPKFVLGESYGGMRSGGVSFNLLTKHYVALNGLILVSPYLDFAAGVAGLHLDEPYVNFVSAYAATAWYHKVIQNRPAELQPFLREVEAFAQDVYAPVLFKGRRASDTERQKVLKGLARYTGVSEEYWDKANLRLDEGRFVQELLRNKSIVVGRIDSRYTSGMVVPLSERARYDAYEAAIAPAIIASFNDYYRQELKVKSKRPYVSMDDLLWKRWDERHQQPDFDEFKVPFGNTAVDLAQALTMNPKMKVLIHQGYFDLSVPYGSVEYVVEHLDVATELRANVKVEYYDAGHMMYVHPPSREKFKKTTAEFIKLLSQ